MKKTFKTAGIVLLVMAVVSLGVSLFFRWMATSVMDATADFYSRMFTRSHVFMYLALGIGLAGAVLLVLYFVKKE